MFFELGKCHSRGIKTKRAIDGKIMKQSYDRNDQQKALHIVTAWYSSHQLVL
jgi:hypothetical protein